MMNNISNFFKGIFEKIKKDNYKTLIIAICIIAAAGAWGYAVYSQSNMAGGAKIISGQEAAKKVVDYINSNFLKDGPEISATSIVKESAMYKVSLVTGGEKSTEQIVYVTLDGRFIFPLMADFGIPIDLDKALADSQSNQNPEVPKSDKPKFELFVMSYCPYSLQAEKALSPVYDLLKNKADIGIYFVDYIMHGKDEVDENINQYCIQKEQGDKFFNYLDCFAKNGKDGNCLSAAAIDQAKMSACVSQTDSQYDITKNFNDKNTWKNGQYPPFAINEDLNKKYSVQGSPTIVINNTQVNLERSPEKIKEAICNAFNVPPEECSQQLSPDAASPGFGDGTDSSGDNGSCE